MAGSESPADKQPPDVEAGQERALSGSPAANGTAKRGALEVAPPAAAADGKSEGYTGADEARKVEHEREVLPEDEKAAKPASYFSLYRWVHGWGEGWCWRNQRQHPAGGKPLALLPPFACTLSSAPATALAATGLPIAWTGC